jgi:hypothetical protein
VAGTILVENPYLTRLVGRLDKYEPDLWNHLDRVPLLPANTGREILAEFLGIASQAQNLGNIHLGRNAILTLPREWTLLNIDAAADETIDFSDEWEYRRLLELYKELASELLRRLVQRGLTGSSDDIRCVAQEYRADERLP